jgi:hypothetical protein
MIQTEDEEGKRRPCILPKPYVVYGTTDARTAPRKTTQAFPLFIPANVLLQD